MVSVSSWFAGFFCLPRTFVNLAVVPADFAPERERLLLMASQLLRVISLRALPAAGLALCKPF